MRKPVQKRLLLDSPDGARPFDSLRRVEVHADSHDDMTDALLDDLGLAEDATHLRLAHEQVVRPLASHILAGGPRCGLRHGDAGRQ